MPIFFLLAGDDREVLLERPVDQDEIEHGDEVVTETRITRFGRSSFDVEHRLMRGDVLAVEGFEKRVLVAKSVHGTGLKSCPIPEEVIAIFGGRRGA